MFLPLVLLLPSLAAAHFEIKYPGSRGFNDETHAEWPCGGFNRVSGSRSEFPLQGGPIQIESSHTQKLLQVLMAVGNEPEGAFNTIVVPTFLVTGPGEICFGAVEPPSDMNITAGTNATFQVISGTSHGGLYGCADVTFTSDVLSDETYSQNCKNSTAVETFILKDASINANETSPSSVEPTNGDVHVESHGDSHADSAGTQNSGYRWAVNGILLATSGLAAVALIT